eukprot:ctg_1240.g416
MPAAPPEHRVNPRNEPKAVPVVFSCTPPPQRPLLCSLQRTPPPPPPSTPRFADFVPAGGTARCGLDHSADSSVPRATWLRPLDRVRNAAAADQPGAADGAVRGGGDGERPGGAERIALGPSRRTAGVCGGGHSCAHRRLEYGGASVGSREARRWHGEEAAQRHFRGAHGDRAGVYGAAGGPVQRLLPLRLWRVLAGASGAARGGAVVDFGSDDAAVGGCAHRRGGAAAQCEHRHAATASAAAGGSLHLLHGQRYRNLDERATRGGAARGGGQHQPHTRPVALQCAAAAGRPRPSIAARAAVRAAGHAAPHCGRSTAQSAVAVVLLGGAARCHAAVADGAHPRTGRARSADARLLHQCRLCRGVVPIWWARGAHVAAGGAERIGGAVGRRLCGAFRGAPGQRIGARCGAGRRRPRRLQPGDPAAAARHRRAGHRLGRLLPSAAARPARRRGRTAGAAVAAILPSTWPAARGGGPGRTVGAPAALAPVAFHGGRVAAVVTIGARAFPLLRAGGGRQAAHAAAPVPVHRGAGCQPGRRPRSRVRGALLPRRREARRRAIDCGHRTAVCRHPPTR